MLVIWENLFSSVPHLSPCLWLLIAGMHRQAGHHHRGAHLSPEGRLTPALPRPLGHLWRLNLTLLSCASCPWQCASLHREHTHFSPPLYLRDNGKSKGSGARLADSSTARINDNCVSLPQESTHASVPHVQDRIKEDLIKRLL